MAATSTQPKNFQGGTVTLIDGTGSPVSLVIPLSNGDFQCDGLEQHLNAAVVYTARTVVVGLGRGKPSTPKWSVSALVGNLVGKTTTAPGSPLEFVTGKGAYAANVSTLGASREITCDAKLTIKGTPWGDSADETFTMEDSVCVVKFEEREEGNRITISGMCLGSIVVVNDANTVTLSQAA